MEVRIMSKKDEESKSRRDKEFRKKTFSTLEENKYKAQGLDVGKMLNGTEEGPRSGTERRTVRLVQR